MSERYDVLAEVEAALNLRWRHQWAEWERLVSEDKPQAARIVWGRQAQALEDAEFVGRLRTEGQS